MIQEPDTSPSIGSPVGKIADADTSREALQLMMKLKAVLQDTGIEVSLAAPDAYAQLLSYGRASVTAYVQQLWQRLEQVAPPCACVYAFDQADGLLTCARCSSVLTLTIPETASESRPVRISCPG